jgi:hypothetical protein
MQNGGVAYVRDGQTFEHGFLGSGLVRAVAGNPGAEAAANEYRGRLKTGLLVALGGLVCSTVAIGLALRDVGNDAESRNVPPALWVSLGCAVASLIGASYGVTAEPYRWDAINIFNDQPPMPMYPAPGGYSTRPKDALRMRPSLADAEPRE